MWVNDLLSFLTFSELAGALVTHPAKPHVTLAHSQSQLLPTYPLKAGNAAKQFLEHHGATVLLKHSRSQAIDADVTFHCHGLQSNTKFLVKHFGDLLDERQRVRVENTLQLPNNPNIFALGDAASLPASQRSVVWHVRRAVGNVARLECHKEPLPLRVPAEVNVLGLGSSWGIVRWNEWVFAGGMGGTAKLCVEWLLSQPFMSRTR